MTSTGSASFGLHHYVYENLDFRKKQVSLPLQCDDGKAIIWSRFRYDIIQITRVLNEKFGPGSAASFLSLIHI